MKQNWQTIENFADSRLHTRHKGVLGASIDEWYTLRDTGNGIQRRRWDLRLVLVYRFQEVLHCVVETSTDIAVPFSVCSPQHNYLVHLVLLLELPVSLATWHKPQLLKGLLILANHFAFPMLIYILKPYLPNNIVNYMIALLMLTVLSSLLSPHESVSECCILHTQNDTTLDCTVRHFLASTP